MKSEGYSPRKVVLGVATARSSELDKRAIAKEKILLVISTKAIAVENQAIGNRARLKHSRFLKLGSDRSITVCDRGMWLSKMSLN